ncbi:MAG TPA: histidine phosphatase family protein [Candidatus Baltobacteraceae bacterium]
MIVLVARHGETTWNKEGRYQGRQQSPLSELGIRQASALADAMATFEPRIERIVSSPLIRCSQTAQLSADRLGLEVEIDDRLIEIGHGDWEKRLRDEIMSSEPQNWYLWKNEPSKITFSSGDSMQKVAERWQSFASTVPVVPTLVVTHDAVVRSAIVLAQGLTIDDMWKIPMENAAYAKFDATAEGWKLLEPCVNAHLQGLRADIARQAL